MGAPEEHLSAVSFRSDHSTEHLRNPIRRRTFNALHQTVIAPMTQFKSWGLWKLDTGRDVTDWAGGLD